MQAPDMGVVTQARRDEIARTHDSVYGYLHYFGVQEGDARDALRRIEKALACHDPLRWEDVATLEQCYDLLSRVMEAQCSA